MRHHAEAIHLAAGTRPVALAAALAVFVSFHLIQGWLMFRLLASFGPRLRPLATMRIFLLSLLGKYIPGSIWIYTMRTTFFAEWAVPVRAVLSAAALENVYVLVTGGVLFLVTEGGAAGHPWLGPAAGAAALLSLAVAPSWFARAASVGLRRLGRPAIGLHPGRRQSLFFAAAFLTTWLLIGFGVWILARGMGVAAGFCRFPELAGAYALAVSAGFLVIFAPGGIGVREGVFAYFVSRLAPGSDAVLFALAVRIITSVAELLALGVAELLHRASGPAARRGE